MYMLCAGVMQDEVDSLGQSRGGNTDAGARRLLTELLIQFTRAVDDEGLYVFGATNRIQVGASILC
jgi:SpoVK/Ycf46/Vps4 family AAA+-type ATPase